MNNNGSSMNTILLVIVLIILVGGGIWWYTNYGSTPEPEQQNGLQINVGGTQPAEQ